MRTDPAMAEVVAGEGELTTAAIIAAAFFAARLIAFTLVPSRRRPGQ
jgi:hypothetical protein